MLSLRRDWPSVPLFIWSRCVCMIRWSDWLRSVVCLWSETSRSVGRMRFLGSALCRWTYMSVCLRSDACLDRKVHCCARFHLQNEKRVTWHVCLCRGLSKYAPTAPPADLWPRAQPFSRLCIIWRVCRRSAWTSCWCRKWRDDCVVMEAWNTWGGFGRWCQDWMTAYTDSTCFIWIKIKFN